MERGVQPNSGLNRFTADPRTFSHSRVFGSLSPAQLPKEFGYTPLKFANQHQTQFCTGAGTSSGSEPQEGIPLSFEFQVAAISRLTGEPIMNGATPYTAMKARIVFGCLPDSLTPEHLRLKPDSSNAAYIADWRNWPQELWEKAKEHSAAAYFRVDGPYDHFDNARIALVQGQNEGQAIIAFGTWEAEWNRVGPDGVIPAVPSPLIGYHCYVIKGFGLINGREYIAAQNSYGRDFGKDGIQYFDRATFNRIWDGLGADRELFIYRDVSPETVEAQKRSLLAIYLELAIRLAQAKLAALLKAVFAPGRDVAPRPLPQPTPTPEPIAPPKPAPNPGELLHQAALSFLGKDASPKDQAPDELACVESFQQVWKAAFGSTFSTTLSTAQLYRDLKASNRFKPVKLAETIEAGDIVICPTGMGTNPAMPHGHVGILGKDARIMSNDSATGRWMQNYTADSWSAYFVRKGGYPIFIFRPV